MAGMSAAEASDMTSGRKAAENALKRSKSEQTSQKSI
jgi:hypothetical protein